MKTRTYILGIFCPVVFLAAMATDVPAGNSAADKGVGTGVGGDAARGAQLYESRCTGCHSLDSNRVGPMHQGVFGRQAGGVTDFAYSRALAASEVVWNSDTLDRWLANPQDLIPGQRMNFRVSQAKDRADIIAFLKSASM